MEKPPYEYNPNEDIIDRMRKRAYRSMSMLLVAVNVLVFLLVTVTGGSGDSGNMLRWGAAYTPYIREGQYYRLLTSMFLHFSIQHLGGNMLLLLFLGDYLERYVGRFTYLLIYLGGGIFGNCISCLHEWAEMQNGADPALSAGASGGVFAIVGAMLMLLLLNRGRLEDLSLRRMALMATGSLIVGFQSSNVDNAAHVGGFAAGLLAMLLLYPFVRMRWKKS